MTIKVIRQEAPIKEIRITRAGFKDVVLTRTTVSGKVSVKVAKEGQQGVLFNDSEAKDLVEAINTMLAA